MEEPSPRLIARPGSEIVHDFQISFDDMLAFARLSGDDNPIHLDDDFARQRGFPAIIVYCGLLVAQCSRVMGTRMPGHGGVCRSVNLKFRAPLYVDEPARLIATVVHANEELGLVDLKIRIEAGDKCVADGTAAGMMTAEKHVAEVA
jgi:3-hydroxybutyryl-CoA dehydratase